jgi:archaellum component FlaC
MKIKIEIQHSISEELQKFLTGLSNQQEITNMAADLSKIKSGVEQLGDVVDSVVTMLTNLAQEVRNAQPTQAALDELATAIESQKQELADAVAANTPADPDAPRVDNTLPGDLPS